MRHLAALRASLLDTLAAKGRVAWLEEELAALANPDALRVAPEEAWRKVKGLPALDPARQQLAQALAAWRERRADERNRPRGWILDDVVLREIVMRLPRSLEALHGAAGDAGVRGAQVRRRAAGAGARCAASAIRRRRCRAASVRIPRSSRW